MWSIPDICDSHGRLICYPEAAGALLQVESQQAPQTFSTLVTFDIERDTWCQIFFIPGDYDVPQ